MSYTLGISAFYHDSAAALVKDGKILAAAQEERFTRKKHDPNFPKKAVEYCLGSAGIAIEDVEKVVFYDKPFLKFERLLETYYSFAPRGFLSFLQAMPVWFKEKLFLKNILRKELGSSKPKLLFTEHHLSHSASAFYPSPYENAAILTIDGVGEWATASISHGQGKEIKVLKELHFPHSVGLFYSAFTYYLGFKVNSGEYKMMGLAPYGDEGCQRYVDIIKSELIDIKEDGSIGLNQKYFEYAYGLKMVPNKKWEKLFGVAKREAESELSQEHCNLALAAQKVTEEIVLKMAKTAKELTGEDYLCLAGGVALNCVANGRLLESSLFKDIWIQPAAGDAGGALGAALAADHIYSRVERESGVDQMQGAYLGPEFSGTELGNSETYSDFQRLCDDVAGFLDEGKVVGWFQGKMEWGPRALGNRSILGDPRNKEMQKKLNLKIKYRESFRPFAPSVLEEDISEHFDLKSISPYMLLVGNVLPKKRTALPEGYESFSVKDKLYHIRSDVPAITHLDYSARVQSVSKKTNPKYWALIDAFKQRTGYGVIVNTSFNVRGEPIVCTPEDAHRCFMRTEMDYLVIGDQLFEKDSQPPWTESKEWREDQVLD